MTNSFQRKLDDKNRLTIPSDIQREFAGGVVIVSKGHDDDSLSLFSESYWSEVVEPALQGDFSDPENFRLNRQLRSTQTITQMDQKQGRIVIEQRLLSLSRINKDVTAFRVTTTGNRSYWALVPTAN